MRASICPCIFCELIHGGGEVSICYEDSQAIAFMDVQPVNAGHVLVVPRQHFDSLVDVPSDLARHLFDVALRLGPIVRRLAGADGLNIIVNSGASAGQDVFHYHVHVIPRRKDDGFTVDLPFAGSTPPDRTLLDAMAARIIAELRDPARATSAAA
jgi:histidine triad (HIT) family protein